MRHVLSALVQNVPGVLAHISGMLASRGYNIDSLAVGETEDPNLSRMTFVVVGDDRVLEQVRTELGSRRERRSVLDTELKSVCETYRDQLGRSPDLEALVALEAAAVEELATQVARARRRIDEMGPVNVLAADEYAEQETRYTELGTQREDIAASVESLRRTIREINQTSVVRFRETLEEVNRHLSVTFTTLFRGGEAEIRLLDEEDVFESGIEIVARPPGKRLQNLMLMSGGEKALTAIASTG